MFEGRTRFNAIVDFRLLQWNLSWSMEKVRRIYIIYGKKLRSVLNFFSIGKVVWLNMYWRFCWSLKFFYMFFLFLFLQILRKLKHQNIIEMLDSFESPQEFCVVTEFAQVIFLSLYQFHIHTMVLCMHSDGFEKLLMCLDFRVNCLRFSRTTNASQKNKCNQLQSSWYFLLDKYCLLWSLPWLLFDFIEFKFTVCYDFPLKSNFWSSRIAGASIALLAFKPYHPSWHEATKHSHWCWVCCQGW